MGAPKHERESLTEGVRMLFYWGYGSHWLVSCVGFDELEYVEDGFMLMEVCQAKCGAQRCTFIMLVQPNRLGRGFSFAW